MKKCIYIVVILIMIIFNLICCTKHIYASSGQYVVGDLDAIGGGLDNVKHQTFEGWYKIYKKEGNAFDTAQNVVIGLVQVVGYIVSVLMVTIIGIKYIFTSPEGKAEVKKQLIPFLIGALLLFSGTVLVSTISRWAYTTIN